MSFVGSCLRTRLSTVWLVWLPTQAPTVSLEPWITCPSLRLCTERATSELSACSLFLWDRQPPCPVTHTLLPCPAPRSSFVRLWPYLFVPVSPPAAHCSLTVSLRCIGSPRDAAALQVYKEGERKMFVLFVFSCCLHNNE